MARLLDGSNWFTLAVSASRHGVQESTVRQWVHRRKVSSHKLDGRLWVCDDDVADCALLKRLRDTPTG